MRTRHHGAHPGWGALLPLIGLLIGLLAACGDGAPENGGGSASPEATTTGDAARTETGPGEGQDDPAGLASAVVLGVAVDLPDTLRRACERWAEQRSARIEWLDVAAADLGRATLREIAAPELDALLASDALRAFGASDEAGFVAEALGGVGRREATPWGLPWRARLHVLRAPRVLDWAGLARTGEGLGLQEDRLDDVFLAFAAAAGALDRDRGVLDTEAPSAVEALAFLTRLAGRATITDAATLRRSLSTGGLEVAALDARLDDAGLPQPHGFPGPTADDPAVVLAEPRLLVLPRGGDHVDLGAELAHWLCEREQAALLGRAAPSWVPLSSEVEGEDPGTRSLLALRERAVVIPYRGIDAVHWNEILDEAVRAAVERRRSPEAALAEARHRREGGERP